jgi:hypothetical protein
VLVLGVRQHFEGQAPARSSRPKSLGSPVAAMDLNNSITHHLPGQAYRDMGKKEEAESELKLAEELQTKQDSHP